MCMFKRLKVKTVDTQTTSVTGSTVPMDLLVNSKKPHHPQAAIISV